MSRPDERLAAALPLLPFPAFLVRGERVAVVNAGAAALGMSPEQSLVALAVDVQNAIADARRLGRGDLLASVSLPVTGGGRSFFSIAAARLDTPDADVPVIAVFLHDITREYDTAEELGGAVVESEAISHELRETLRELSFRNRVGRALQETRSVEDTEEVLRRLLGEYLPLSWFGLITDATARRHPPALANAVANAFRGHLTAQATEGGAALAVPVRLSGVGSEAATAVYCVVAALSPVPTAFTGRQRDLLLATIDLAAIALRNTRLYQDVRAHSVAVEFLNEELARTISDLKAANAMKSRFVSIVSHEFRTPLTSIASYVDTLLAEDETLDAATRRSFLGVIRQETSLLTKLINQLLGLSRIQAHDTPLERVKVDARTLVDRAIDMLRPLAVRKSIALGWERGDEEAELTGDPDALTQVFINIIANAIRYTPAGGRVDLSVASNRDFVYILVRDTGIGIPADCLDHIFDEFFTVERTDRVAEEEEGDRHTGLGLAIAKAFVERHGGRIEVKSTLGVGSEFGIRLPRKGART